MAYTGKGGAVNDLVLLDNADEAAIVDTLRNHHSHQEIYTYIGPVLISVNPYRDISNLYGPSKIKKFVLKKEYENNPHVYAVAERAYRAMVNDLGSECVIVTGESGAGKTEASKKVMEYVAAMSSKSKEVQRVKNQLLESNPLLESFGNAKTVRNDNSSRFGKYMEIQFLVGDPAGGKITTYLLEKSRVVGQQKGERNFHVFYELLCDRNLCSKFNLSNVANYAYLSDPSSAEVDTVDDKENGKDTRHAMEYIGVSPTEQDEIYAVVASLLHLGNCDFTAPRGAGRNQACGITDQNALQAAAQLLGLDANRLGEAITFRTVKSSVDTIKTPLNVTDSKFARDSMAKSIYNRLFDHIVRRANEAITCSKFSTAIAVLDIYGFEILGVNGFEQLCINYTNEKLHQLFIELTLKAEQEEYKKEGIAWKQIKFYNNKPICDLVEKKGGIFSLMDEESIFPNSSDTTLFNKMKNNIKQQEFQRPNTGPATNFMIKHYAGTVTYDVNGMLDRNKDTLFPDIVQCLNSAKNSVAKTLFQDHQHARKSAKVFKRAPTTCMQYKLNVQDLMNDLSKCNQHYIRCIKPNDSKAANLFDDQMVTTQARYLGLMENVKVRRAGFAFRMEYKRFAAKYKCVLPENTLFQGYNPNAQQITQIILDNGVTGGKSAYEMGKSKVFIKEAKSILKIEEKRKEFLERAKLLLPPEEDGLIFADKVVGFNEKFVKSNLTFCVGAQGFYWYNGDGSVAQFFPMDKIEYIGYNRDNGWMTVHATYLGKKEGETVALTYLSENVYGDTVENFVEVMHSMGYDKLRGQQVNSYPQDAVDQNEYKLLVKQIGKGEKATVAKGRGVPEGGKFACCTVQ